MLCQSCHQNTANTCIKTTVGNETKEYMLCSACAQKLGYVMNVENFSFPFNMGNLLAGVLGGSSHVPNTNTKRCPKCNMSYDEISSTGKVGCEKCYETFSKELLPIIERIHGKSMHVSRRNSNDDKNHASDIHKKILILKDKMQDAIKTQNFEMAAELRDQIKILEGQVNDDEQSI